MTSTATELPPPPAASDLALNETEIIALNVNVNDPPPPYPSRSRRTRNTRTVRRSVVESEMEHEDDAANESTPLIAGHRRPRSNSHGSVLSAVSAAPSLAQTLVSLFDEDEDGFHHVRLDVETAEPAAPPKMFSLHSWKRYFRPMVRKVYWKSFFHLAVLNFPYALAAWVYLFVFTLTGTTLLMALPLGAILCFLNLIGARVFSRGELAIQTTFHSGLAHPPPYPPRPIFARLREANLTEIEAGRGGMVREPSFYKNTYAMFTDPLSYQALFYFLVIKPAITMSLTLVLLVFVIPALVLVLPAPAALRAVRKLGVWQANIAVEGLYFAVR